MSEERLKEIKDSIDIQYAISTINKESLELIEEEIELYNEVVRLQNENKEAKEQIKLFKKDLAKVEEICQKYNSRYYDIKLILTLFEKWLKEEINKVKDVNILDPIQKWEYYIKTTLEVSLDKLQELKGEIK